MHQPEEVKLYDIYDIYYKPWWSQRWFVFALTGLFLLGLVGILYRWYRSRRKPISPVYWQQTLDTIAVLESTHWTEPKDFYALLTSTLKDYLEKRFDIRLLGATDQECLERVRVDAYIPEWIYNDVKQMLDGVAFVKFAGAQAGKERMEEDVRKFKALVLRTLENKNEAP